MYHSYPISGGVLDSIGGVHIRNHHIHHLRVSSGAALEQGTVCDQPLTHAVQTEALFITYLFRGGSFYIGYNKCYLCTYNAMRVKVNM